MDRRQFVVNAWAALLGGGGLALAGCRGHQVGQVLRDDQKDMSGSCAAGAETYKPLIDEAVGKLLARHATCPPDGVPVAMPKRICFVGVENAGSEEMGDFKAQLCEIIDNRIVQSKVFQTISRRVVDAGLRAARLRADELFLPGNQRAFLVVMEQSQQPFDYLLFAKLTTGTTSNNGAAQKDYLLTLELVNIHDGSQDKESADLRKVYYRRRL